MQINFHIILLSFFLLLIACGKGNKSNSFSAHSPAGQGKDIFTRMACDACHSIDGSLKIGPTLKGQYGREIRHIDGSILIINDQYILESLIDPLKHIAEGFTPIMPSYRSVLQDKEIEYLIAYIKALK